MGVGAPSQPQPRLFELGLEVALAVDADVTAWSVVVVVVERPAHSLRPAGRDRDGHATARSQHADQLADRLGIVPDVLEHLGRDDAIERVVGERQRQRVTAHRVAAFGDRHGRRGVRNLTGLDHRRERRPHRFELVLGAVERGDARTSAPGFEGVTAATAPEVEQARAHPHVEPVEVDGQHQAARGSRPAGAWSRSSWRYWSTVPSAHCCQVK